MVCQVRTSRRLAVVETASEDEDDEDEEGTATDAAARRCSSCRSRIRISINIISNIIKHLIYSEMLFLFLQKD